MMNFAIYIHAFGIMTSCKSAKNQIRILADFYVVYLYLYMCLFLSWSFYYRSLTRQISKLVNSRGKLIYLVLFLICILGLKYIISQQTLSTDFWTRENGVAIGMYRQASQPVQRIDQDWQLVDRQIDTPQGRLAGRNIDRKIYYGLAST